MRPTKCTPHSIQYPPDPRHLSVRTKEHRRAKTQQIGYYEIARLLNTSPETPDGLPQKFAKK